MASRGADALRGANTVNAVPVFCLSFHADYRCRHSGACCTSGWAIPVEAPQRVRLESALASGSFQLTDGGAAPGGRLFEDERLADGSSILRVSPAGACACYDSDARRCSIHAQLGHDALPVACQHFPRVCLIDRDATSVTLSHYCPTAARMVIGTADPLATQQAHGRPSSSRVAVVEAPPGFAPMALEGLDARDTLPPLLRPRMLADRASYRAWEREVLKVLDEDRPPERALLTIINATEQVRAWGPGGGALDDVVQQAFAQNNEQQGATGPTSLSPAAFRFDALVRECVPEGLGRPAAPASALEADARFVAATWPSFAAPIRRYLATKAFASWVAYQGRGLRTVVASLVAAVSVLRVEACRQCAAAGRPLDEALLIEAVRSADLLLVHLALREEFARRLGVVEETGVAEMREALVAGRRHD